MLDLFGDNKQEHVIQLRSEKMKKEVVPLDPVEQTKEEAQLNRLMKLDAQQQQLHTENDRLRKERERIVHSRTWRYGAPLRTFVALRQQVGNWWASLLAGPKTKTLLQQNKKLAQEKADLERELHTVREQLKREKKCAPAWGSESEMEGPKGVNSAAGSSRDRLRNMIRKAKHDGQMLECLDDLIQRKEAYDHDYHTALTYAGRLFANEKADYKHLVYRKILSGLKIEEIPEFIVRAAEHKDTVPLQQAASFRASLSMRQRKRQCGHMLPEWVLDHQVDAYRFIDDLQVYRPWVSQETFTLSGIPKKDNVVLKPVHGAGSRGVYLVFQTNHIQDVKRSRILQSWEELELSIKEDLASGWVSHDEWMMEELMLEEDNEHHGPRSARDIKCYCFYGKVALILEVDRFPELKYCWWTPNGERISTGKYDGELFHGQGISQEELKLASSISLEIPAPFIRIDFLKTARGMAFGEFTPKPGNYDQFDQRTDQLLGDYFLQAEARLMADLLYGKQFVHFHKLVSRT